MYKRILLKLSGEALSSATNVFDFDALEKYAKQIKEIVDNGCEVGIVCGGGNICRGQMVEKLGIDRVAGDEIGMLATTINSMTLACALKKIGCKAVAMSAVPAANVETLDIDKARKYLSEKTVVCFGGGTGSPFFTTDTASSLRASEINAEVIFLAKNGVDGVYDSDPKINPNAKRFNELTFDDIIKLNLKVIDSTAASMCKDNKIKAFVFNMNEDGNIVKAVKGEAVGTLIR